MGIPYFDGALGYSLKNAVDMFVIIWNIYSIEFVPDTVKILRK